MKVSLRPAKSKRQGFRIEKAGPYNFRVKKGISTHFIGSHSDCEFFIKSYLAGEHI